MSSQREWIKQRLPGDASFSKHGMQQSVDEAINSALSDHADESATAQKKLALADLLDIVAADIKYAEERLGEWTGRNQILEERAAALRSEAENETDSPGSFSFVPATFTSQSPNDEFSA